MKHYLIKILTLVIILNSCINDNKTQSKEQVVLQPDLRIPDTLVNITNLVFDRKISIWSIEGQLFSGYALEYYEENKLKSRTGILNGRKQNQDSSWYENGNLKQVANYNRGKLHGDKKYWASNNSHILLSHLKYQFGKPHGTQKTWYPTGELHKELNLAKGKEEGIQKAYRKNGALYANYEARNGRIFGLKKTALCFGLEDQKIPYEK